MKQRVLNFAVISLLIIVLFALSSFAAGCGQEDGTLEIGSVVAKPTITPSAGVYTSSQTVTIKCSTSGAIIRYTTDSSEPTQESQAYTGSLTISSSQTIKAKAFKTPSIPSSTAVSTYEITGTIATPTISPVGGTYSATKTVTIECGTSGVEIRYTTDGTDPTSSSILYSAPITVSSSQTIKAKAFRSGWTSSSIASATYVLAVATPTINLSGGTYLATQTATISCTTSGAEIRYTTDGTDPTASSTLYSTPISVSSSQTIEAKAFKFGWTSSSIVSATYTITLSIEVVDTIGNVGKYSSIALDSNNDPHISYFDRTNETIKYIYWNGTAWQAPATVDTTLGDDGGYTSIAIDSNDKVHASYFDDTNGDLIYATNVSGAWVVTTVDSGGVVGKYTFITVDPDNFVHISYFDVTNDVIKYATNKSGAWVTTQAATAGTNFAHSSIAIDSRRKAHISFYNNSDTSLYFATNMSGSWESKSIDSSPSELGSEAGHNSIVLDNIDDPYIAYNGSLKYSRNAGVAWESETVDSAANMKYLSLAKDSDDKLYISYFDNVNDNLKYATNSSGNWLVHILDSSGIKGRFSSIAVDTNGKFHISYYDDTNQQLKYATNK